MRAALRDPQAATAAPAAKPAAPTLRLVTESTPGAHGSAPTPAPASHLCRPTAAGGESAGSSLISILDGLADDPRFAAFAAELRSTCEEIQNRDLIDGIEEEEALILEAVRLGYTWERDIAEQTGIELDRVIYVCGRLAAEEPPRLEAIAQGGKTEAARGRRKRLWVQP